MDNMKDEYMMKDSYTADLGKDEEEDIDAINSIDDLDVSIEELVFDEQNSYNSKKSQLSETEFLLIERFRSVDERGKQRAGYLRQGAPQAQGR